MPMVVAPAVVRRCATGTDSDATDAMIVGLSGLGSGGADDNDAQAGRLIAASLTGGGHPNSNRPGRHREDDTNLVTHALTSVGHDASEDGTGRGTPLVVNLRGRRGGANAEIDADGLASVRAAPGGSSRSYLAEASVRRLTTVECQRLTGLPDDYFGTPNTQPDAPRYAACGDAVTVPVAEWIGRRILEAEAELSRERAA